MVDSVILYDSYTCLSFIFVEIKLTDDEFVEFYAVFKNMPAVKMDVEVKVEDEDEDKITAGSIVTITTKLTRESMGDITEAADNGEVKFAIFRKF